MMRGIDTVQDTTEQAGNLYAAGCGFVGRYLSQFSWKVIRQTEAAALKKAGLLIVLIYEDGPTSLDYFCTGRGADDAGRAVTLAAALQAPTGTAIYFAVDYDAGAADIGGPIAGYFQEITNAFIDAAENGMPAYAVGIYGSGLSCSTLKASGWAGYTWLAQSEGWAGFALPDAWDITQGPAVMMASIPGDGDNAEGDDIGAM